MFIETEKLLAEAGIGTSTLNSKHCSQEEGLAPRLWNVSESGASPSS